MWPKAPGCCTCIQRLEPINARKEGIRVWAANARGVAQNNPQSSIQMISADAAIAATYSADVACTGSQTFAMLYSISLRVCDRMQLWVAFGAGTVLSIHVSNVAGAERPDLMVTA